MVIGLIFWVNFSPKSVFAVDFFNSVSPKSVFGVDILGNFSLKSVFFYGAPLKWLGAPETKKRRISAVLLVLFVVSLSTHTTRWGLRGLRYIKCKSAIVEPTTRGGGG